MFRRPIPLHGKAISSVLVLVFIGIIVFATQAQKGLPGRRYTRVTAVFSSLPPSLRTISGVRIRGLQQGKIRRIYYADGHARVEAQLPSKVTVYRDATARIRARSLIGQRFVEIDPGTPAAGPLGGSVIPLERTQDLTELDQILDALDPETRAALSSGLRELGGGIAGHGRDLGDFLGAAPGLIDDSGTVAATLAGDDAHLADLLRAAATLAGRFNGREETLERLNAQLARTFGALTGGDALQQALDRLPGTLDAANPAVADLGAVAAALRPALADLRPGGAALGAATPDLRAALREAVPVLRKVPGVSGQAVPALTGLTGVLTDARPLAPSLRRTLSSTAGLLGALAPYSVEVGFLIDRLPLVVDSGDQNGRWLRLDVLLPSDTGPTRDPYPAPGQAGRDGRP